MNSRIALWKSVPTLSVALFSAAALASLVRARDTGRVVQRTVETHAIAAHVPLGEFVADHTKRIDGHIRDLAGHPVQGASVQVFDVPSAAAAYRALASHWEGTGAEALPPAPPPEVRCVSGADGRYATTEIGYGWKVVTVHAPGFHVASRRTRVYDGYGASDFDFVLKPAASTVVSFRDPDGTALGDLPVTLLPGNWGEDVERFATGADGLAEVAASPPSGTGRWMALVGEPPLLVETSEFELGKTESPSALVAPNSAAGNPAARVWSLPKRSALTLVLAEPATSDSVKIRSVGAGALTATRHSIEPGAQRLVIEAVFHAAYDIELECSGSAVQARVRHDGTRQRVETTLRPPLRVQCRDGAGTPLDGVAIWRGGSFRSGLSTELRPALVFAQATTWERQVEIVAGFGELRDLPAVDGELLVECAGHAAEVIAVTTTEAAVERVLSPSMVGSFRSALPYTPVSVRAAGSPPQYGLADAFGEAFFSGVAGPAVVWQEFPSGHASFPAGVWLGSTLEPPMFARVHEHNGSGGCIYGFVTDRSGAPVEGARVLLAGTDGPSMTKTDAHGFYRAVGRPVGPHRISARRPDDPHAQPPALAVTVPSAGRTLDRQVRCDLRIWDAGVHVVGGAPGQSLELTNLENPLQVLRQWVSEDGSSRITGLRPSSWTARIVGREGDVVRSFGTLSIDEPDPVPPGVSAPTATNALVLLDAAEGGKQ